MKFIKIDEKYTPINEVGIRLFYYLSNDNRKIAITRSRAASNSRIYQIYNDEYHQIQGYGNDESQVLFVELAYPITDADDLRVAVVTGGNYVEYQGSSKTTSKNRIDESSIRSL